jgi:flagellar motor switch protein FliN
MSDSISQEEIDALIKGAATGNVGKKGAESIGPPQVEEIGAAAGLFLTEAGNAGNLVLGAPVATENTQVVQCAAQTVTDRVGGPLAAVRLGLTATVTGPAYLVMPEALAREVVAPLLGKEVEALGDEELSALAEGVSQMAGAGLTKLSALAGGMISLEPVTASAGAGFPETAGVGGMDQVFCCEALLTIGEEQGPIALVLPVPTATSLLGALTAARAASASAAPAQPAAAQASQPAVQPPAAPAQPAAQAAAQPAAAAAAQAHPAMQTAAAAAQGGGGQVAYQPATFKDLTPSTSEPAKESSATSQEVRNIDLLLDVTLEVTVELGRTRRRIRDVLSLGPGSIVEIDKLAGEAVDVLVNGKLVAKGEVVIIDDNYGVRINDIISPAERVQSLNR